MLRASRPIASNRPGREAHRVGGPALPSADAVIYKTQRGCVGGEKNQRHADRLAPTGKGRMQRGLTKLSVAGPSVLDTAG